MPGTPITDLSENELPSPTGIGLTEEGAKSSYILPYWDESNHEVLTKTSKDKFLLKVAIEASLAKLNIGWPLKKKEATFTKGRKLMPNELRAEKYVFDVVSILKKSRMESSLHNHSLHVNLNHLSKEWNIKGKQ